MSTDTKKPWAGPLLRAGSVPTFDLNNPTDWVIPGILPRRGTALLTGISGAMKTSFIIHALHTMAHWEDDDGAERSAATQYHGPDQDGGLRRTFIGPDVSFIALEAEEQTEGNMRALAGLASESADGRVCRGDGLAITSCLSAESTILIRPNASDCPEVFNICAATEDDTDQLYRFMKAAHVGAAFGWGQSDIIVVDSVAQALAGRPENTSETMSAACRGLKLLQPEGGLFIGIHHGDASHNKWHSRGHTALPSGVDHVVNIQRKGDVVTVRNLKSRGFGSGVVRRYQAVLKKWTDIEADGVPEYAAWVFEELPPEEPKASASASKPASAPPDAPKAAEGPKLNRTPLAAWNELSLKPGDKLALPDARERIVGGAVFAAVDSRRRAQKLAYVLASFERAGLVVDGHIVHPQPTEG